MKASFSVISFKIVTKEAGDYIAETLFKGQHVTNSPLSFTVKSEEGCMEESIRNILEDEVWKSFGCNKDEDNEKFGESLTCDASSPIESNIVRDESSTVNLNPLNTNLECSLNLGYSHDLTKFSNWRSPVGLVRRGGSAGVVCPIGFCILSSTQTFVVASTMEDKVKMYNLENGCFIKDVIFDANEGPFMRPSDMVSLKTGKFAVRDERRIMIFDEDGKYLETVWRSKGGMRCYGLAVDGENRLACLMETRSHSLLNLQLYDLTSGQWKIKVEMVSILGQDIRNSRCRFLTYHKGNFYITDNGLNKVYIVQEDELGYSVGEFLNSSHHQFNDPGGVALDDAGNIVVVDSKNHQLCLFSVDKKLLRKIPVKIINIITLYLLYKFCISGSGKKT